MPMPTTHSLVLIADDESDFAESVGMLLQTAGHACRLAADGDSACLMLQRENFDVVLMDYRMPGNQNLECLQYVTLHYPEIPVLLVTGYPSLPSAVESLKLRVFDYVTKPFDPHYLRRRVGEAVEWKRLRSALRESESHFRELFEGIADAVLVHDPDGAILDVNEASCLLFGYSRNELTRMNLSALMAGESDADWHRRVLSPTGGACAPFETFLRARKGHTIPCEVIQRAIIRGGKSVTQSVARDITARRKAEENLRWRNRQLAAYYTIARTVSESLDLQHIFSRSLEETLQVMDSGLGALFVLDDDGQLNAVAHRGLDASFTTAVEQAVHGRADSLDQIIGEGGIRTFAAPGEFPPALREAAKRLHLVSMYLIPIRARGVAFGLLLIAYDRPGRIAEPEAEMLEVIGTEVGVALENGKLYSAIMDSERRYRQLFEEIGDPVLFHDFSGSIQAANEAACALLGFAEDELLHEGLDKVGGQQYARQVGALMKDSDDRGRLPLFETTLCSRTGRSIEIEVHARIMTGARSGVLSVLRDVTARNLEARRALLIGTVRGALGRYRAVGEYLRETIEALRTFCGCESVAIRLADSEGRLPFTAQAGFSEEWMAAQTCRTYGEPPCLCQAIVRPTAESASLGLTPGGSFVCENLSDAGHVPDAAKSYVGRGCLAPPFNAVVFVPIRRGDEAIGLIHLADPRPVAFLPFVIGCIEEIAAMVSGALRQYDLEASLAWEVRQTEIGFELTGGLLAGIPLEQGVRRVLDQMAEMTTLDLLAVERLSADTQQMEPWIARGGSWAEAPLSALIPSRGRSIEAVDAGSLGDRLAPALRQRKVREILTFPIRYRDQAIGSLAIAAGRTVRSDAQIMKFLIAGADQLAAAIAWADAQEQLDRSRRELHSLSGRLIQSLEEERARIARELHDSLGQILTSIGIDVDRQIARQTATRSPIQEVFDRFRRQLNEAQTTVRQLTASLRPGILDDLGLVAALESYLEEFQERTGIVCRFDNRIGLVLPISADCSVALYRVAQEALTNTARHAQAKTVNVALACDGDAGLVLAIQDDGRGFDPSALSWPACFGLLGMRERLQLVGGRLHIQSQEGAGAAIRARVPLRRET